ncbi:MAG TPA: DUF2267 domain-containing protein [Acidimicrobiia bacterium]|nr:DUF2267 domain-containing protein [Acidimicrobiia bacterium]
MSYRLRRRHPDPGVADDVLADRVRSSLGPLVARLDLPHVNVMVEDHTALLHGDVATAEEGEEIERAVAAVSGVVGVESFLHVGLVSGDTRPSEGARRRTPSEALRRLLAATTGAGVDEHQAPRVLRAVLSTFAERLPPGERKDLEAHLPADVRELTAAPRRLGEPSRRVRTVPELVARVASADGLPREHAESVIASVLNVLRELVPEEAGDISAALPKELRGLWEGVAAR